MTDDLFSQLAAARETFCYASPGSEAEFTSLLLGFDTAVGIVKEAVEKPAQGEAVAWQKPDAAETKRRRAIESHHDQMLDAMTQCAPCRLCGGKAIIGDAGPGHGYYIECSGAERFRKPTCLQGGTRVSGWAYNVSDLWNRLNAAPTPPDSAGELDALVAAAYRAGFEASGEGWNGEYPFGDRNIDLDTDVDWCEIRDRALTALRAKGVR